MLTDVATNSAFYTARRWLQECQDDHAKCPGKKAPTLPSRVIDVGSETKRGSVKLLVNSTPCKAHYTALSYCWGGSQQVTTTKSTLDDHVTSIPYDQLPKTIQDAVMATRNLGISYLWADALCIVQDCAVDKAQEINKMGQIYKNATLTIAAASAKTAHEGFLQPRPRIPSCEIPIYYDHQYDYDFATVQSSDADEPLYSRGWTLQERLLSPRMLLYGQKELTWQCQQNSSESLGTTFYQRSTGCKRLPVGIFVNKKLSRKERPSNTQTKQIWQSIIEDRLPALAGIAEQLHGIWGDYVAGFWKNCMLAHLA
ncbi:HET-domain-containing protein [Trematosphaeria pertusa]|uniref:HET-domain-containing protein n=1 Tax=Trematosphaeria pertusa TaxID=390896 RepID=A0A6A6I6U2_9PLEO|nr:HET-domain-containing protein [Trematosphaeria pertusa]KAF2246056.1 HET-domain-containing protein [Trematosphaeria pertusa]